MIFEKISKVVNETHRFEAKQYRMASPVGQDGIVVEFRAYRGLVLESFTCTARHRKDIVHPVY